MKKYLFLIVCSLTFMSKNWACAYYDPETDYFNLFAQELIQEPAYFPFLLIYDTSFYDDESYGYIERNVPKIQDENIKAWVMHFNDELTYSQTDALLKIIALKHIKNWKKGVLTHVLSKEKGAKFYQKYQEAFDYILLAKTLEPYMRIQYIPSENEWYSLDSNDFLEASDLPYEQTLKQLTKAYHATQNAQIKERYAFQIVRFLHYTRHYADAVKGFEQYFTKPSNTPIYWYAVNQYAGALSGLGQIDKANYNFLQVFMHSKNLKKNAYNSLKIKNQDGFEGLLGLAKTTEEKNMAYFLLAYNEFTNPVPFMKNMIANDADSDILKVLTARAINQLERNLLPFNLSCYQPYCSKIKDKRLPISSSEFNENPWNDHQNFITELQQVIALAQQKSDDAYWDMSQAYLLFLQKEYDASSQVLSEINTDNQAYLAQIGNMQMLNKIMAKPTIDAEFEQYMLDNYAGFFDQKSLGLRHVPTTFGFVADILANRYFLQGEKAKSYLLHNEISELQYNPDINLVRDIERFYRKTNKSNFDEFIISLQSYIPQSSQVYSFFEVIYGDNEMRNGDFAKAISHYGKVKDFKGIPRYDWDNLVRYPEDNSYDGFNKISPLIFGYNQMECFNCPVQQTMVQDEISNFDFIPNRALNKLELAQILLRLQEKSSNSGLANKLIGNVIYNTSALGYFREVFVSDWTNENSPKYHFSNPIEHFDFYYKNYSFNPYAEKGNFELAIDYYQKAMQLTQNKNDQAGILFQIASAEQGLYYKAEAMEDFNISWEDPDYSQKQEVHSKNMDYMKNTYYRKAFGLMSEQYADTQKVQDLKRSCSYFNHFFKTH